MAARTATDRFFDILHAIDALESIFGEASEAALHLETEKLWAMEHGLQIIPRHRAIFPK